jgi:uncharacterized protein (TIGR02118 family)
MIKVTVLYPNNPGSRFDHEYYRTKHIPMVASLLGSALRKGEIDRGLASDDGTKPPLFHAIGYLYLDSMEAFGAALGPHATQIMGDIPNYTDVAPSIQYSEVVELGVAASA